MKTILFSLFVLQTFYPANFGQNRICEWDTEKIIEIRVEYKTKNAEALIYDFKLKTDLDAILSFLKKVEFREVNSSNMDLLEDHPVKEYKISFTGQRDQVYLYGHSACVGKTSFLIDEKVSRDFNNLVKKLQGKKG